ncbi:MAG TPA: type II secretion system protein GspN [Myxococcales bacterium]|nr:type II secretion system protein GspN [Myxococcales bacterium]
MKPTLPKGIPKGVKDALRRALAYGAFGFITTLLFVYLTFPWDAVRAQIESGLERSLRSSDGTTFQVAIGKLEPSWFTGIVLKQVVISAHDPRAPDAAPDALLIPQLSARLELLPLLRGHKSASFAVKVAGGETTGRLELGKAKDGVTFDVAKLDLTKAHDVLAVAGKLIGADLASLDIAGTLSAHAVLELKPGDLTTLDGTIQAGLDQAILKGGKVGELDLPQVGLGRLELEMAAGGGKLDVHKLVVHGDDLDVTGDGVYLMLNRVFAYSSPHGKLKIHFGPDLLKRIPYLGMALNALPPPDREGNYNLPLAGTLRSPRFM